MNIQDGLLEELYRRMPKRAGISAGLVLLPFMKLHERKTIYNAVRRLKNKRYVAYEGRVLVVTAEGKKYLKRRAAMLQVFDSPFSTHAKKNLLLIFDIPETRKAEREWLRRQLRIYGYEMIQQSAWFGPSPLPDEFVTYLKDSNLSEGIRIFKVTTPRKDSLL